MFAIVELQGGVGRAFEKHCADIGSDPGELISAMVASFVAEKNMPLPPPANMGEGTSRLTAIYDKMRSTYQRLNKDCDKIVEEIKSQMSKIEMQLLSMLNENKVKNMTAENGMIFYKQKDVKPSGENWDEVYKFITDEQRFDMLERRLTKTAVEAYMEEHGKPPPGVKVYEEWKVIVRKGKGN